MDVATISMITTTLVSITVSAVVSIAISIFMERKEKEKLLSNRLDTIIKIWIEHPYLENTQFTSKWTRDLCHSDEKLMRYEAYGTLVFNYLHDVACFYNYDVQKIEEYISIKAWVRIHETYWKNPLEKNGHSDEYGKKFVEFIDSYIKGH